MPQMVEEGIPLPAEPPRVGRPPRYNWSGLTRVGQSFFVPAEEAATYNVRKCAKFQNAKGGPQFEARRVDGGTRVWRVE